MARYGYTAREKQGSPSANPPEQKDAFPGTTDVGVKDEVTAEGREQADAITLAEDESDVAGTFSTYQPGRIYYLSMSQS